MLLKKSVRELSTDFIPRRRILEILAVRANVYIKDDYLIDTFITEVARIPPADVVEVVRCKDCEYYEESPDNWGYCKLHECRFGKNGFCSYGERREE